MKNSSGGDVPIAKGDKFSLSQCYVTDYDEVINEGQASCFISWKCSYAHVRTRSDSEFSLSVLGRFQSNPGLARLNAGKKV